MGSNCGAGVGDWAWKVLVTMAMLEVVVAWGGVAECELGSKPQSCCIFCTVCWHMYMYRELPDQEHDQLTNTLVFYPLECLGSEVTYVGVETWLSVDLTWFWAGRCCWLLLLLYSDDIFITIIPTTHSTTHSTIAPALPPELVRDISSGRQGCDGRHKVAGRMRMRNYAWVVMN